MAHRLDSLLQPSAVAVVGASQRADSMGDWALTNLLKGGYEGDIYPVNPRYDKLAGLRCYAALGDLPVVPELVIFAVGDARVESALDEAIACGVPAAVIMSTLFLDDDTSPALRERVQRKVNAAGMLVCGANGMGFYNVRDRVWACGFDSASHEPPGNVSLISHSGAGMCGIVDCEERLRINVAVSTGNELSVTMDEYLDFVLDLPETRVVGLFIETARNPDAFRAALEKAAGKRIPVVGLKVGRTEKSAQLAVSHSGAMAGDDAAYEALFDRYGVQRVNDMQELTAALILFAELHPVGAGGLVALHDSGGERQLMVDLADAAGVEMADLGADTIAALEAVIDPELPAVNPLDGWSRGGPEAAGQMTNALTAMLKDDNAAMGAILHDRGPDSVVYPGYMNYLQRAHADSGKPVALVAAIPGSGGDKLAVTSTRAGYPVLDGVAPFLRGVRALFEYRDFLLRDPMRETTAIIDVAAWRTALRGGDQLDEQASLALFAASGIAVPACERVTNEQEALTAARRLGYPLVLKTAMPAVAHKSDSGGVVTGIGDDKELAAAYSSVSDRLGAAALLATMAPAGVEMLLGARRDPQFGPVVLLGFGGVHAETLDDVQYALPPFDAAHARRLVDRLRLRALLDGKCGAAAANIDAFCEMAATFSQLVDLLGDCIAEIDVNPVIVSAGGCTAVDGLVVGLKEGG